MGTLARWQARRTARRGLRAGERSYSGSHVHGACADRGRGAGRQRERAGRLGAARAGLVRLVGYSVQAFDGTPLGKARRLATPVALYD